MPQGGEGIVFWPGGRRWPAEFWIKIVSGEITACRGRFDIAVYRYGPFANCSNRVNRRNFELAETIQKIDFPTWSRIHGPCPPIHDKAKF